MQEWINGLFDVLVGEVYKVLFYDIYGFPLIVLTLLIGSITFTFYFRFINIRAFKHSIEVIKGKYDNPQDKGQISHFQALTSALSGTIGLGNIAGVAIAVTVGGPGAVFWMMFIAVFSMSAKFVSGTLSQMYRKINSDGSIDGGPMYYLDMGLKETGRPKLGRFLGIIYAIFIIGGALGGGNMFQSNQSFALVSNQLPFLNDFGWLYGTILAVLVGTVIIGGIKRIGKATEKIVPLMVVIYILASLTIIFTHIDRLPSVITLIFSEAFNASAIYGGGIGYIVQGIRRAVFSNEGGVGSASIAHSAAKTDEPVREGIVAMIGPFIDTIVICFMTACVILISKEENNDYKIYQKDLEYQLIKKEMTKLNGKLEKAKYSEQVKFIENQLTDRNIELEKIETDLSLLNFRYEEKYIDTNMNDSWDEGEPFKDIGNGKWDDNEQYTDNNKNGKWDEGEPFKDIGNGKWDKETDKAEGAILTSSAFESVLTWFPAILTIVVFLFSYSTMISWYYYGDKSWTYLFGRKSIRVFQMIYLGCVVLGAIASLGSIIDFSDMMLLSAAFPNIIGAMFLLPKLKVALNEYWKKYQNKEFKTYETSFIKDLVTFKKKDN